MALAAVTLDAAGTLFAPERRDRREFGNALHALLAHLEWLDAPDAAGPGADNSVPCAGRDLVTPSLNPQLSAINPQPVPRQTADSPRCQATTTDAL